MPISRRARVVAALALAGSVGLAACGDKTEKPAMSGIPTTTTTEPTPTTVETPEIAVRGIDYAFEGIPATVEEGTAFTFTNGSDKEAHELILVRINDDETRSVQELLALPEDEVQKSIEIKGVSVAPEPGGEGGVVEGDLSADEAGRWVALCFIPQGTDPQVYIDAAEAGGPPEPSPNAGPPHFVLGMVQEFTVE